MVADLFTGDPLVFGGLSNEEDLTQVCPPEFKRENLWSVYAMMIFFRGGNTSNWQWKSANQVKRARQQACFMALLQSFDISHEDKQAVAGWMLSEMLYKVPKYMPAIKG